MIRTFEKTVPVRGSILRIKSRFEFEVWIISVQKISIGGSVFGIQGFMDSGIWFGSGVVQIAAYDVHADLL